MSVEHILDLAQESKDYALNLSMTHQPPTPEEPQGMPIFIRLWVNAEGNTEEASGMVSVQFLRNLREELDRYLNDSTTPAR